MHNTGSDQIQAAARVPAAASLHTTEQQQSTSCRDAAAWREQRLGNECCSAATPACTWPPSLMSCSSVFLHLVPLLSCADTQRRVTSSPVLPFGTGSPATYAMGCDCICVELWCVCVCCPHLLLQGAMAQCRLALKPDGLFLAAMFGGETLQVGRTAVQQLVACSTASCDNGVDAALLPSTIMHYAAPEAWLLSVCTHTGAAHRLCCSPTGARGRHLPLHLTFGTGG